MHGSSEKGALHSSVAAEAHAVISYEVVLSTYSSHMLASNGCLCDAKDMFYSSIFCGSENVALIQSAGDEIQSIVMSWRRHLTGMAVDIYWLSEQRRASIRTPLCYLFFFASKSHVAVCACTRYVCVVLPW